MSAPNSVGFQFYFLLYLGDQFSDLLSTWNISLNNLLVPGFFLAGFLRDTCALAEVSFGHGFSI